MSIVRTRDARQMVTITQAGDYVSNAPFTTEELRDWLRIPDSAEDALLSELQTEVLVWLESALRRYLVPQKVRMTLDHWPCQTANKTMLASEGVNPSPQPDCSIVIGKLPVNAVDDIQYIQSDGTSQTVDPSIYFLDNTSDRVPSRIFENDDKYWPTSEQRKYNSVQVNLDVGYASGEIAGPIKAAVRQMVAKMYTNRGDCDAGTCANECSITKKLGSWIVAQF